MCKSKRIDMICGIGAVIMVLITLLVMCGGGTLIQAAAVEMPYVNKLFSTDKVHQIDIVANESDWQNMLDNATAEEYIACTVVIDGEKYANVAIRPKGNSSLSTVASSDSDRYSFKIEFDHYNKNTGYHGLDKLCLNNAIQDNTYMKDYISYQMMNYLGADAPLSSFAWITVNGSDWGLYTVVEAIEDSFAQRKYGNDHGEIYKPDSMDMGGGGRGAEMKNRDNAEGLDIGNIKSFITDSDKFDFDSIKQFLEDKGIDAEAAEKFVNENESISFEDIKSFLTENGISMSDMAELFASHIEMPEADGGQKTEVGFDKKEFGGMGSSDDVQLIYTDDDPESYPNIFDNSVFDDVSEEDKSRLISALKAMNSGDIEEAVDVDEVLRYFAVHNFVLNDDSYTGSIIHNYYLREKDGVLSMIAWDYNLAFGGMGGMSDAESYVNSPIDSPVTSGDISDRPMVAWIFDSDEYTERYHQVMNEFIETFFESGEFESLIDSAVSLISPYVEKDPTAFCTYEEFEKAVQTLKEFCLLRAESVRRQLNGEIPSTDEGQATDKSNFVEATGLSLSDMGSQNTGMDKDHGFDEDGGEFGGRMAREAKSEQQSGAENLMTADSDVKNSENEMPVPPNGMEGGMGEMSGNPPEMPDGEAPNMGGAGGFMGGQPGERGDAPPDMPSGEAPTDELPDDAESEAAAQEEEPAASLAPAAEPEPAGGESNGENPENDGKPERGENRFQGGMGAPESMVQPANAAEATDNMETWILLGASFVILLAGLIFAKMYR